MHGLWMLVSREARGDLEEYGLAGVHADVGRESLNIR
jgi:hypothetical protein